MTIYYQPEIKVAFETCMDAIEMHLPPTADQKCPHCGLIARHPIVVRDRDIQRFEKLMSMAQAVLDRHGVFAHLLSELHTEIALSKAKQETTP